VTGTYVFTFSTVDAGTNIIATENNSILRTFNSTAESITNTGNSIISLGTTLSTYRTASNGTAFLGNGVSGQIKVISSTVSDTWVVTAASASWPSARVTFANPGQTATLAWNSSAGQWVVLSVFGPPSLS
jgi:hypothetical protein